MGMVCPAACLVAGEEKRGVGSLWRTLAVMLRSISRRPVVLTSSSPEGTDNGGGGRDTDGMSV